MEIIVKNSFCVIGKEGSTNDGEDFVARLWDAANSHFDEVKHLAVCDEAGPVGIWGAMSDFGHNFLPWQDHFSKGLYLAGVEVYEDSLAPKGWKKWIIPGFKYLKVKVTDGNTFSDTIDYMEKMEIPLVGAVQDFTDFKTGINYMLFPIEQNDSKDELIKKEKGKYDQQAICGLHCDYCFLAKWCGGCRSGCNVCSYATIKEDNVCPNVACSKEKGIEGCYQCEKLIDCTKGFYNPDNSGANCSKALALFIKKYGKEANVKVLKQLHKQYEFEKLQEVLDGSLIASLQMLENIYERIEEND